MKNPIVLDGERTCYNCAQFVVCYARRKQHDTIIDCQSLFNVAMRKPDWQKLFTALACACRRFEYKPDPPPDDDEPRLVTLVIQIPYGESQALVTNLQAELAGCNATLHTHDMREVIL